MGEENVLMTGQLYINGQSSGFTMTELPEFVTTTAPESNDIWGRIDTNKEMSFTCHMTDRSLRNIRNLFIYGWKQKAPVRKKMLERAQKLIPYVLCYISEETEEY